MATDPKAGASPGDDQFLDRMSQELTGWSDPSARLRQALDRDELQLYCQPILALRPPGGFVMAEVLAPGTGSALDAARARLSGE